MQPLRARCHARHPQAHLKGLLSCSSSLLSRPHPPGMLLNLSLYALLSKLHLCDRLSTGRLPVSFTDTMNFKSGMTLSCTKCRQTTLQMDQPILCHALGASKTCCTCAPRPSERPFADWGGRPQVPGREALACGCEARRSRSAWSAEHEMFCSLPDLQAPQSVLLA